jgi:hypothetical protein
VTAAVTAAAVVAVAVAVAAVAAVAIAVVIIVVAVAVVVVWEGVAAVRQQQLTLSQRACKVARISPCLKIIE